MTKRIAYVTGGMGGIGTSICQRLAKEGYTVVAGCGPSRDHVKWIAEQKALGYEFHASVGNVGDWDSTVAAFDKVRADFGNPDILVNNAGITGGNATTWELDPAVWRRVVEVNLVAPYLVCRHVVPAMMKAGYGRIVNIASVAGKEGNPNASHYSASKAGLIALTKSLGKELATKGVLVNAITPAVARTAMFEQMTQAHIDYMLGKIPMGRFLEVQEIAAMAAWLASEDCSFSTGAVFDITGGRATY